MGLKNKKECDLHSCMLCTQALPAWLPAIAAHRKCFRFKKGELIFREGDTVAGMFFINTGLVKVHKHWGEDKELILRIAGNADIVGHRGMGGDTTYPVSATALKPTEICYVEMPFFEDTLKANPEFLYRLMMFFASELKESEKRMRNLAHMPVKGRIANAVLFLGKKFGTTANTLHIALSRQDFASYIGATYETVSRMLNELCEEKALRVDGKVISILSEKKLQQYIRY